MTVPCSSLGSENLYPLFFSVSSQKSNQLPDLFLWFPSNPTFTLPVSKHFYLRCGTKFQELQISETLAAWTHTVPPGQGHSTFASGSQESSCMTTLQSTVYSTKPAPKPAALCRLSSSHTGNLVALRCHHFSCNPRYPQTILSLLGFCPLCHLSTFNPGTSPVVANLKVQILCSTTSNTLWQPL